MGKPSKNKAALITPALVVVMLATLVGLVPRLGGCQSADEPTANARQIASRADLIGGPGSLGEVGDYLLENGQIRVVIQGPGFSRGFGVYGGSLIDADLARPVAEGDQLGGNGRDQFGELFPLFFLEAQVPEKVEVLSTGEDGGAARVKVSGTGGQFLTLTKSLNQVILNSHEVDFAKLASPDELNGAPKLAFSTVYELAPDVRYIKIETSMTNITDADLPIPSDVTSTLLNLVGLGEIDLDVPLGHVLLFGAGNSVFSPGEGYNIRFALEDSYGVNLPFPALPGLLADGLMTTSRNGVSYGFVSAGDVPNFAANRLNEDGTNQYEEVYPGVEVQDDTLLVPFVASAFTGVFYAQAPKVLTPEDTFTFTSYFIVGNGDANSVQEVIYDLKGVSTEKVLGFVRDKQTLAPVEGASVLVYEGSGEAGPISQFFTDAQGQFLGQLPPGDYRARVEVDPDLSDFVSFTVGSGGALLNLEAPTPATVTVQIRDELGRDLPGRVTIVGTIDPSDAGKESRQYLFDLEAGQEWRPSDFIVDDPTRPETLQYIEARGYTADGNIELEVRPGKAYTIFVSRGMEYDVQRVDFRAEAGQNFPVTTVLKRVIDTTGYISADFHLHAAPSLDSSLTLEDRVTSCIGEGVEMLVATDHNFVTDYQPTIEQLGVNQWASSMVGLELTTLEAGHFNGFPLKRDVSKITRGSFEWSLSTPDEIFDRLRSMGKFGPDNTIIQVNHARDSILGYFSQHGVSALDPQIPEISSGGFSPAAIVSTNGPAFRRFRTEDGTECQVDEPNCNLESTFSFNFDAMEIFNGKRQDQVRHFRMPPSVAGLDISDELRDNLPNPGSILCDGGEVAFPGLVDDWFNLLNQGYRIAGLGNSDSHDDHEEEPGFPRSYVFVGNDDPAFVDELAVVRGLQSQRAIVTNGPFVELFVNGQPIGSDVKDTDGTVEVRVKVQAAPWVDVSRGTLILNGQIIETFDINMSNGTFEFTTDVALDKDSWLVTEVVGFQSLFPVVAPLELGPINLTEAVGSLAGPLGFGSDTFGDLTPAETRLVTPYAITNPIWVLTQGDEFQAPGIAPVVCDGFGTRPVGDGESKPTLPSAKKMLRDKGLTPSLWFPRDRGATHDIRALFDLHSHHSHAH